VSVRFVTLESEFGSVRLRRSRPLHALGAAPPLRQKEARQREPAGFDFVSNQTFSDQAHSVRPLCIERKQLWRISRGRPLREANGLSANASPLLSLDPERMARDLLIEFVGGEPGKMLRKQFA